MAKEKDGINAAQKCTYKMNGEIEGRERPAAALRLPWAHCGCLGGIAGQEDE